MRGGTASGHEGANFAGTGEGEYEEATPSGAFWGSEVEGRIEPRHPRRAYISHAGSLLLALCLGRAWDAENNFVSLD
jgi:hypothetical protein